MKNSIITTSFLAFWVLSLTSFAQPIPMEKTLSYINQKLEGKYTLDVKKGYLHLECFDQGKLLRKEDIELMAINVEAIAFGEKEKQIALKCRFDQAECIDRILPQAEKKTQVSRTAISVEPDGKTEKGLVKALIHMTKLVQYKKYSSEEWFEQ